MAAGGSITERKDIAGLPAEITAWQAHRSLEANTTRCCISSTSPGDAPYLEVAVGVGTTGGGRVCDLSGYALLSC